MSKTTQKPLFEKTKYQMDTIPVELLEVFFLQLPSLNDIQKCYNTNIKWQEIIKKLFSNKGTIIAVDLPLDIVRTFKLSQI